MSTTLVPQVLGKSCWAASLEMFTERQLQQCDLLRIDHSPANPPQAPDFCDSDWIRRNRGRYTGNTKTLGEVDAKLHLDNNHPFPSTVVTRTPSFADLQNNIGASAITLYSWDTGADLHFVVPNKTFEQRLKSRILLQWIKVSDPFPVVQGRTYYLNYREFSFANWFKGIIYHGTNPTSTTPAPRSFSGTDPRRLVNRYIGLLPDRIDVDFKQVTCIDAAHSILDYEFIVTNTNVELFLDNQDHFLNNILALARDMKMYLAGMDGEYTAFFLNSEHNRYYISSIENGLKYYPVVEISHTHAARLATMGAAESKRSREVTEKTGVAEEVDGTEKSFAKYFEKSPRRAFLCRFSDIGQEYVFFNDDGRVRVYDPFNSFDYILPKDHEKTTNLSIKEFINALTQFYPFLNKK